MFTFLPRLRRSTRCRTCSTHTSSSQPQQNTVCSQEGQGGCKHWALRKISKLCSVFICCAHAEAVLRLKPTIFACFGLALWLGLGHQFQPSIKQLLGKKGIRNSSRQHFSNIRLLLETYQTQTFICFLKTYREKQVLLFFTQLLLLVQRPHFGVLQMTSQPHHHRNRRRLRDQQHNLASPSLLLENLF